MNVSEEDTAKNPALPSGRSALPWLLLAVFAIAADQASKAWILARFEEFQTLTLLPVLDISRWHNQGAAFSFLSGAGGWQRWLFTALALVVSVAIVIWLKRLDGVQQRRLAAALTLIMGGAIGNVIDRIHHGYVVDFIVVHWQAHYFPAFNVADSCITIGAGLLILDALIDGRGKRA